MEAGQERKEKEKLFFPPPTAAFLSSPGTRAGLLYFSPCVWRMLLDIGSLVCFCPWPRCAWADDSLLRRMVKSLSAFPSLSSIASDSVMLFYGLANYLWCSTSILPCFASEGPSKRSRVPTCTCFSTSVYRSVNQFGLWYLQGAYKKCHNNSKESQLHILYPQLPRSVLRLRPLCCSFITFSSFPDVRGWGPKEARYLNNVTQCER